MWRSLGRWVGRLAVSALLTAAVAGPAGAQTTGTIVGRVTDANGGAPVAGALVVVTSPALQGEQTAVTDARGDFVIPLLPPGRYRVAAQVSGYQPAERTGLALQVDYTLRANLALVPEVVVLEPQVVRSGVAPVVNVGTAETGGLVSSDYLATVPTARDYQAAIAIIPTAIRDAVGFGLGGSTSPENNYILDGFRVSDASNGSLAVNLLNNFVSQIDVKTGGFMPEYGYSSGGVVNTILKSGSNEFHGSVWGNLTPGFFTPRGQESGGNGDAVASYSSPYKGSYDTDFGVEVGGPILKDRLWFYAGLAGQLVYNVRTGFYRTRVPSAANPAVAAIDAYGTFVTEPISGTDVLYGSGWNKLFAVGKLTWLVSEDHTLFASFNTQPAVDAGRSGLTFSAPAANYRNESNATNATLGYGGKLLDKHVVVEANLGFYDSYFRPTALEIDGVATSRTPRINWLTLQPLQNFVPSLSCPYASRQAGIGLSPGCYVQGYSTGGSGYSVSEDVWRLGATASVAALFSAAGQHILKAGVQLDYGQVSETAWYSGGSAYVAWGRFLGPGVPGTGGSYDALQMEALGFLDPASVVPGPYGAPTYANWCTGFVDGRCVNQGGKDTAQGAVRSMKSSNWANGFYLQDSWTIANVLTLGFGVRLDVQSMENASPDSPPETPQIHIRDSWAPRVQATWDFTGQGRGKAYGNWGRYYESIPQDVPFLALSSSPTILGTYQLSSCSAALLPGPTSQGNPASDCPNVYGLAAGQGPGPNVKPLGASPLSAPGFSTYMAYYDPVAPGLKGQYTDQFGGGVQYEVLQDLTVGVDYLGRRQGNVIEDTSSDGGATYFISNPSASAPWTATSGPYEGRTFNPQHAASEDARTGLVYTMPIPRPERSYDAVTVSLSKLFSRRWLAQASYTWSSLRGNYSGLIRTDAGQLAPNLLSEFDMPAYFGNRSGPLGSDRVHQVKAAGSYVVPVGSSVTFTPGMLLVAMSGKPMNAWARDPLYGNAEVFLIPRGTAGSLPWQFSLDLSARLDWVLAGPYTLSFTLSIFNVLNEQAVTNVDQRYTLDFANPVQGAQCSAKNAVRQKDPLAALAADCPDLVYARTLDGRRITPNLNFGRANGWMTPVSARFGVALSF